MSKQPIFTPDIKPCYCGAKTEVRRMLDDCVFEDGWQVTCENDHSFSKKCRTINGAVHKWNNRMSPSAKLIRTWDRQTAVHIPNTGSKKDDQA